MDEHVLKQLWLNSCNDLKVEINSEKLVQSITHKIKSLEKSLRRRDRREISIAAGMILLFGCLLIKRSHWMSKVGAAIIIAGCFLVIINLLLARRNWFKEDTSSVVNDYLWVSLQNVRKQIKLLDTLFWWYLLPFFVGAICIYYSFPVSFFSKAIYTLTIAALYVYIYYLNRSAIVKVLKPLEEYIQKLLTELKEPKPFN